MSVLARTAPVAPAVEATVDPRAGGTAGRPRPGVVLAVALLAALLLGPAMAGGPPRLVVGGAVAVLLVTVAFVHPPAAAYLLLGATPLLAGFARDSVLPVLRLHEALGLLLGAGVCLRAGLQLVTRRRLPLRWTPVDTALLVMALASSVLPLLWMAARGLAPSQDDLLYAATLWKFSGLFLLIRASVRTERQVTRCLWICLAAGVVVAVLAILQSTVDGVADVLYAFYPEEDNAGPSYGRGSATLGSSIAVGDVMAFDLAICLSWVMSSRRHRRLLVALAVLFAFGAIGSGQFSGILALLVAVLTVAVLTGQVRRLLLALVPTAVVAGLVLWPVIQDRLSSVDLASGLPQSWWVREQNLELFIWPRLFSGVNWLFGVEPAAVLDVSAPWGTTIYIESGHTWLLWIGGVPFLLAYLFFTWIGLRTAHWVVRSGQGAFTVAATGSLASLLVCFVLMTFDPHITMRGTADLLFSLLALTVVGTGAAGAPRPAHRPRGTRS
jgi:hypothetical protein